ncbi:MAG: DUF4433 domain-containing protein [Rhabdochlamydiaceae bacterium]|jgi:hypothetical protein
MVSAAAASDPGSSVPAIFHDGSRPSELYFITSIENVHSILKHGILSHKRAASHNPTSIANDEVQSRREHKIFSNPDREQTAKERLPIHRCVNLYIRAHNAMLFVKKEQRADLCVFRIHPQILGRCEVVIADRNASKDDARFYQARDFCFSPVSSEMLQNPLSLVWNDKETLGKAEKRKYVRQAEVLIPYALHPSYIQGIFVADSRAREKLLNIINGTKYKDNLPVDIHPTLFFSTDTKNREGTNPLARINAAPLRNGVYPRLHEELPESSDEEHETHVEQDFSLPMEEDIAGVDE